MNDRPSDWVDDPWERELGPEMRKLGEKRRSAASRLPLSSAAPSSACDGVFADADESDGVSRGRRWFQRIALTVSSLIIFLAIGFVALWWRLGAGPIDFNLATPWLIAAIESNIGDGKTVEVGGTQIERSGPFRIAVRIRDIVVLDRNHAVVASAPKAEVKLSGLGMLRGELRAESLNFVDAVLSVQIKPDGTVVISTGSNARPITTAIPRRASSIAANAPDASATPPAVSGPTSPPSQETVLKDAAAPAPEGGAGGLASAFDWLDSLSQAGLDGAHLNEIGLKNGNLIVDDQQRGNRWTFDNINLNLRRPLGGGIAMTISEQDDTPWSLAVSVSPPTLGARTFEMKMDNLPVKNLFLAARAKDLTYSADLPISGEIKGEVAKNGVPNYLRGKLVTGKGAIIDEDTPDYPMLLDQMEVNLEWDPGRQVLLAPFKAVSGGNRVTLLAHIEFPRTGSPNWQLGLTGGTIVLGGNEKQPLIFNNIAIKARVEPEQRRVVLTQADIGNGEIGLAGTGSIEYAGEPRLTLGFAGTPMSATALKRMWPILIVPEVREWVLERVERGQLTKIDIGVNAPIRNLSRRGPPIPDEGLAVDIRATGVGLRPVDGIPSIKDGELRARVTGRSATVSLGQASLDTQNGRKIALSEALFEVPDMVPKPSPARVRLRVDAQVPAIADFLASDRLKEFAGDLLDASTTKGNVTALVTMAMPIQRELTKADTKYTINADVTGFSADKLVMNQKIESNSIKLAANNQGYQVKGDVKINGQAANVDYRKPSEGDAELKLTATIDDAGRAKLGADLGSAVTGPIGVKVAGKLAGADRDSKFAIEADLTPVKLDNLLPGWAKPAGKAARATFNLTPKGQQYRIDDLVVEGGGASIKGALELDADGDLVSVNLPTYSPSEGDKTSIKADRNADGVLKVVMRGDVFDSRGFLKSALSGRDSAAKSKSKAFDFDLDLKLGAVAGYSGEAIRSVDVKLTRRNGTIKTFTLNSKLGRDTPLTGEIRRAGQQGQGREVILIETNDAGSLFRFTDIYAKMVGGQLSLAFDPPSAEPRPSEGLLNIRNFAIKGEAKLDDVARVGGTGNGVAFTRLRAEFVRFNGKLTIREGVVKGPAIGATIEGQLDYPANRVRMNGTIIPAYGLNNMFGQIPIVGLFMGGSNEGLFGVTYEVVGSPGQPDLRVNPLSAMAPGVLRKIFEFGNTPVGRPGNNDLPN